MSRHLLLVTCLLILAALSGCQEHTAGLERSIARADETSALAALHAIATAEQTYSISNSGEFGTLKQLAGAGLLPAHYSDDKPLKDYIITLDVMANAYKCNADPDSSRQLVGRHLYIDSTSNLIHVNETQTASASDKAME